MTRVKKKVVIIGSINTNGLPSGGEEYKNQLLTQLFRKDNYLISIVDTYNWSRRPIVFLRLFYYLFVFNSDNIIISASSNSVYKLLRVIHFFQPKKLESIIYFVLGGFLPGALQKKQYSITFYRRLRWIIVQGQQMKEILISLGLKNVVEIPNFKNTKLYDKSIGNSHFHSKKLIFISTICREKGVDLIFEAISLLKKEENKGFFFEVDFYGPIDKAYKSIFEQKLKQFSDLTKYCGYLDILNDPFGSYSVMEKYKALLFPTCYEGEGFPGIFIDAFICGLPVITTDWHMNNEIIKNEINGLILENNTSNGLINAISKLFDNPELSKVISLNNKKLSEKFDMFEIYENRISVLFTK